MIVDTLNYMEMVLALIPAAFAASNPVVLMGLGTAAMLVSPTGF